MADTLTDLQCFAAHLDGESEDIVDAGIAEIIELRSKLDEITADRDLWRKHCEDTRVAGRMAVAEVQSRLDAALSDAATWEAQAKNLSEWAETMDKAWRSTCDHERDLRHDLDLYVERAKAAESRLDTVLEMLKQAHSYDNPTYFADEIKRKIGVVENSCRREAAPTPAPLLDGLSAQAEPSNPSAGVDGADRESPQQTSGVERHAPNSQTCPREGCPYVGGPDFSIGNPCRCAEPGDGLGVWRHST